MESIIFSRNAYKSATRYYNYLKEAHLGKETINVISIERLKECKYILVLSKKLFHLDSIEFKINSDFYLSMELKNSDITIFEYNENRPSIVVHTSPTISRILSRCNPQDITLESDLTFLVKSVRNWYKEYHDRISPPSKVDPLPAPIPHPETASNEQLRGLRSILTSPMSYVWGAPGTGKTQMVLAHALLYHASHQNYTLLMAPTNNALEQSLRGVLSVMDNESISHNIIMRLGRATSEFLLQYPEVCEVNGYELIGDTIRDNLDRLKEHLNMQLRYEVLTQAAQTFTPLYEKFTELQQDFENNKQSLNSLTQKLQRATSKVDRQQESFEEISRTVDALNEKLRRQQRFLYVISLYSQYNEIIEQYQTEVQSINDQLVTAEKSRTDAQAALNDASDLFSAKLNELSATKKSLKSFWSRIRFIFSKKFRLTSTHTLELRQSAFDAAAQNLAYAKNALFRITEQIKALEEGLVRKERLLAGNTQLFEISRSLFSKALSYNELKEAFDAELAPFSDFVPDDTLDEKVQEATAHQTDLENRLSKSKAAAAKLSNQIEASVSAIESLQAQVSQQVKLIEELSNTIFEEELSPSAFKARLASELSSFNSFEIIPNIDDLISEKESALENLLSQQKELLRNRYIIACTVDYAMLHYDTLLNGVPKHFSHIFVDEAAYCPLIKAGVLFSFDAPVALLGDHMQLPPICEMNKNVIKATDENRSVFLWDMSAIHFPDIFIEDYDMNDMFLSYINNDPPKFQDVDVTFLTKTFRFGALLARVLDEFVYQQGFHGSPDKQVEIVVLDAKQLPTQTGMRESRAEALAIKSYLDEYKPVDYVIMSPYKKQCRLIEQELHLPRGNVLTVHASQGREWDTVILSVTDGHDKFFMDSKNFKSNGLRIVNTAISRAKRTIVLALDYGKWENCADQLITGIAQQRSKILT